MCEAQICIKTQKKTEKITLSWGVASQLGGLYPLGIKISVAGLYNRLRFRTKYCKLFDYVISASNF